MKFAATLALACLLPLHVRAADSPAPNNGCEIECPNADHPNTVVVTCPVPKECPHASGKCRAVVYDYTNKPGDGTKPVTKHLLKSITACGCVVKVVVCACIPNGEYEGCCTAYRQDGKPGDPDASECRYLIPCKEKAK